MRLQNAFPRLAAGAFILEQGLSKLDLDREAAEGLQGMAAGVYPPLGRMEPEQFLKVLTAAEILVGTALLVPFVSPRVAGALLSGFSGALLGLYLNTPGLRREGSLRPTQDGIPLAKDSWMLGIGLGLLTSGRKRKKKKKERD